MQTKFDVGQRVVVSTFLGTKTISEITIDKAGIIYTMTDGSEAGESLLTAAPRFPTIIIPRQSVIGDAMAPHRCTEWYVGNTSGEDIKADAVFIMRLGQ